MQDPSELPQQQQPSDSSDSSDTPGQQSEGDDEADDEGEFGIMRISIIFMEMTIVNFSFFDFLFHKKLWF